MFMGIFRRQPLLAHNNPEVKIEIEAGKRATKEAIEEARRANEELNRVLVRNGFTVKIFVATGGKHKEGK